MCVLIDSCWSARAIANDKPRGMNFRRFHIVAIGAGITNVWIRQRYDLATVGRVREDFLIACHRGIENHFANGLPLDADRRAVKNSPIL